MDEAIERILDVLVERRGLDLSGYRPGTVRRRITFRMARLGIEEPQTYLARLEASAAERDALVDAIAVNVSGFFRDPLVFDVLARRVVPALVDAARRAGRRELRCWSAGCAAGEEAYSLAILLCDELGAERADWTWLVFATDIDRSALRQAREGVYARASLADTRLGVVDRWFEPRGERFRVVRELRRGVVFSEDDLTSPTFVAPPDSVFGAFDLILCRNVLIYFGPELRERVLRKLTAALAPGGYLVLGESEAIPQESLPGMSVIHPRERVFRAAPVGAPGPGRGGPRT